MCSLELPPGEPDHEPWASHVLTPRLHASPDGTFAAIVHDYGRARVREDDVLAGRLAVEVVPVGEEPLVRSSQRGQRGDEVLVDRPVAQLAHRTA